MFREIFQSNQKLKNFDRFTVRLNQALSLRSFQIGAHRRQESASRVYYTISDELSKIAIERLNSIIKSFYKVRQSDRSLICNQIKNILEGHKSISVIKIDLKSFYVNVDTFLILGKIKSDRLFCPYTFKLLECAISPKYNTHTKGLPEGICLSATLSELYMREIDRKMSKIHSVSYYARFVDDIIIMGHKSSEEIFREAKDVLAPMASINPTKIYISPSADSCDFSYLGYRFRKNKAAVSVLISELKIKKIKSRLILSLIKFQQDQNLGDLFDRIKYLTGNHTLKNQKREFPIKSGIYYTYPLLTKKEAIKQLEKLDSFLRNIIYAKHGRFGRILCNLDRGQRDELTKFKFSAGHKNRIMCKLPETKINNITKIWHHA